MFTPRIVFQTNLSVLRVYRWCCEAFICVLASVVLGGLPTISLAQAPSTEDEVLRVNTELLLFPIRVRDHRRETISTLRETDLFLKDNDRVTKGLYFSQGLDRVSLLFALDRSGSTRDTISFQRDAAIALFERFGERSKIAVLRFAERPELVVPFDREATGVREAFNFATAVDRHTAIFDAAAAAVIAFDKLPRVRSERRIVILISDGLDNASGSKANAVIAAANKARVSFYVIQLPLYEPRDGRLAVRPATTGFRALAEKTNGRYFLAGSASEALSSQRQIDLAPTFQAIEEDLRSQYLLGFYLSDVANDGRKHHFSLILPAGFEYQVGQLSYSRSHEFFIERPREALKFSQ